MNETEERASQFLQGEAENLRTTTQAAIEEVLLNSILDALQYSERLSVWMLAITGASIPLLVSNADAVLVLLSKDRFRLVVLMLIISGLFGALAKARDMQVQIWRHLHRSFLSLLPAMLDSHQRQEKGIGEWAEFLGVPSHAVELSFEHLLLVLEDVAPRFYRRRIREAAARGPGDPLGLLKGAVRASHLQACALVGQMLFFASAAALIAWP